MDQRNVKSFINEYKEIMNILHIDIAHSELQDRYFVFRSNSTYVTNLDYFVEVKNEEDLVGVIISELAYDMWAEIGMDDVDTPECVKNNIADMIDEYSEKDCLPEVAALLTYIKENISGKDSEVMKSLESLVSKK